MSSLKFETDLWCLDCDDKSKNILKHIKEIEIVEFDHKDVFRHPLVSKIIRAYQKKSADDKN